MPAETFPPIADPLSLPPAEFVAEAERRGYGLGRCDIWWDPVRHSGCAAGVAAVLKDPIFARKGGLGCVVEKILGISRDFHCGLVCGFDGMGQPHKVGELPDYDKGYAYGQAVNAIASSVRHAEEPSHARD